MESLLCWNQLLGLFRGKREVELKTSLYRMELMNAESNLNLLRVNHATGLYVATPEAGPDPEQGYPTCNSKS